MQGSWENGNFVLASTKDSENEALRERVSRLESALTLAIDLVDHWGGYASEYFQQKYNLAGDLATLRAALAAKEG